MNDYSIGAMEALSYAKAVLDKYGARKGRKMIDETLSKIVSGTAVNFKEKTGEIRAF